MFKQQSATSIYDIAIWEAIRHRVESMISTLIESIKSEISRDWSISELQGLDPVPWQLRQILQLRAGSWIQRLYDICCDAHKRYGNQVSQEFDRAAWAYCIDPFIMREVQANEFAYRASVLMELLLCAVGSPANERTLLRVCQKECCLAVRLKIYESWYDKLHHLPPRIDQAARALATYRAIEIRAARIARGLPPEPMPLSAARTTEDQAPDCSSVGLRENKPAPLQSEPVPLPPAPPVEVQVPNSASVDLRENKPAPEGAISFSKSAPTSIDTIEKNQRREAVIRKIRNSHTNTIVSVMEAALYFEVEGRTIYRWTDDGDLKKGARRGSITIESILQWETKRSRKGPK